MKLTGTILFMLLLSNLSNARQLQINGTVEGDLKGFRKIYFTDFSFKDSVEIKDGKFNWSFPGKTPVLVYSYTEYHSAGKSIFAPTPILADKATTVELSYDLDSSYHARIKTKGVAADFINANDGWLKVSSGLTRKGLPPTPEQRAFLFNLIKNVPDSYSTVYFLEQHTTQFPPAFQEELYAQLPEKSKLSEAGSRLRDRLEGYKNSVKDSKVIEFSLKDSSGKTVSIRNYEGKFVIVDFWASWCGPCRASFPHLRSLYEKYHSRGLEIISISIDLKKPDWLKAVKEEDLPWAQLLDDQHLSLKGFGVTAIPHLFLLSRDGKFIFQQLGSSGGESPLDDKLKTLFEGAQ